MHFLPNILKNISIHTACGQCFCHKFRDQELALMATANQKLFNILLWSQIIILSTILKGSTHLYVKQLLIAGLFVSAVPSSYRDL